jgi:hypothetical protein
MAMTQIPLNAAPESPFAPVSLPAASPAFELQRIGRDHPDRVEVEGTIRRRYWRAHRATRCHFLDHLLVVRCHGGNLRAALGIGEGCRGPFFLESYLDAPVERALAERVGSPIDRAATVEIGTLVSFTPRATTALILLSVAWLAGYGVDWGVFTATEEVRDRILELGVGLLDLGVAHPARLGAAADEWGRYYRAGPRVVAASFDDARRLLTMLPCGSAADARAAGARTRSEGVV